MTGCGSSNSNEHLGLGRRQFLGGGGSILGVAAFAHLLGGQAGADSVAHFPATAKRVIFLQQSGAPSQLDLFDHKPGLLEQHGTELPESIRRGQRLTSMTAEQDMKLVMPSPFEFSQHGESGLEFSELLPHTASVADHLCVIRSMHTTAINHDPAMTLFQTGSQQPGRPSIGAWTSYGLGSGSEQLPAFLVMVSGGQPGDQPLFGRLWGAGFLPSDHQGVKLRGATDPILFLSNPAGIDSATRRRMIDSVAQLNQLKFQATGDSETLSRIKQFELAYEMQTAVPDLVDFSDESAETFELYGETARQPGSYAANCLLARRLVERGVRFIQLYHRGWDHHLNLKSRLPGKCRETDQSSAALIKDLARRGLLDETLVVWAGEFGRTVYCQGDFDKPVSGRDHHPRCFSIWLAGGGVRGGVAHGQTDDFSYNIVKDPVHVHDLHATILHCLGIDHERFTYLFQGRHHRLTDVAGEVIQPIL